MSQLSVGQLRGLTVNNNIITVPSGHQLIAPGHVLQVVGTTSQTRYATTAASWLDTDVAVTITPKSSSSKLLTITSISGRAGGVSGARIVDGSGNPIDPPTSLYQPSYFAAHFIINYNQTDGNLTDTSGFTLFESNPVGTVSAIVRRVQIRPEGNGTLVTVNRPTGSTNATYPQPVSTIVVMEIAQ